MEVPYYRPKVGISLYALLSALDFPYVGGDLEGMLSLAGFLIVFAWSQVAPIQPTR